jgi:probable H4MPT-linked C1 transfer pathway protein
MAWLGLDVGGANLKAADAAGFAASRPFALWRAPDRLTGELRALLASAPHHRQIAVTMTAELADCYATKAEGVRAVIAALGAATRGCDVWIYTTRGELVAPDEATDEPLAAAASNWHALAALAVRWAGDKPAVLIDVGSTTTDLIPLVEGRPAARGATDPERLQSGELVYMGVERTPVAAIVSRLPWRGAACPVATELFATSADAYVLLGDLPAELENCETADGRPRTREAAHARLARMVCADATMYADADALAAATAIRDAQLLIAAGALRQVVDGMTAPPELVILSGHGEFLAQRLVAEFPWGGRSPEVLSLNKELGPQRSRCAPAYALAVLAEGRRPPERASLL